MREGVCVLSSKAFTVHRAETLRMSHVLGNSGKAFPYSETKKKLQLITMEKR